MFRSCIIVLIVALAPSLGRGQTVMRPGPPPEQPTEQPTDIIKEIQFENVPLNEAIQYLAEQTGKNIVLQAGGDDAGLMLPITYRLRDVPLSVFLELLQSRPDADIKIEVRGPDTHRVYVVNVEEVARRVSASSVTGVESLQTAFAHRNIQGERLAEEVSALVDAAMKAAGDEGEPPVVIVHPPTQMVIFRGTDNQVRLLHETFGKLKQAAAEQGIRNESDTMRLLEAENHKLRLELEQARVRMEMTAEELKAARAELRDMTKRLEEVRLRQEAQANPSSTIPGARPE
ncbi:MAG TPA: hypothetical protein PKB10_04830 [Tepidisphaeraceae bacterium]|nr:hypothetical protein [Tepidisphaeraceae bacterium]